MTNRLTYADRELLLRTFDGLKAEWNGNDDELLTRTCDWAKRMVPSCGFEHSLIRDIASLSQYLVARKEEHDLATIARGGLLFILSAEQQGPSRLGDLGLLGNAFVANYALHEIRTRLGSRPTYNPPRPSVNEQRYAETLFLQWAEKPLAPDEELAVRSREICRELASLASCGLFRRLQKNVDFLISALNGHGHGDDAQSFARAALSYLIHTDDAISDRMGIVGYLDDNFVAQMAVDLIEPARDPWLDMLDATVGAWPFLNGMVIDDGAGPRPLSEYMIINAALSCPDLRTRKEASTLLVLPASGPTAFLLGFVASLALLQRAGQRTVTVDSFQVGQKVLVDNAAVAEYSGTTEIGGRPMFGLTQYHRHRGQELPSTHWWPMSDLSRLVVVDDSRATRGTIRHNLDKSDAPLPPLDVLFNARSIHPDAVEKKVVVVTSTASALEYASRLKFHGCPLKDIVPMGQVIGGVVRPWSSAFGQVSPLLCFVSDLDAACAYVEDRVGSVEFAVVDMAGRNANKAAGLAEMRHFGIRTLTTVSERDANDLALSGDDAADLWEWDATDMAALLWPPSSSAGGVIAEHEERLQKRTAAVPQLVTVSCEAIDGLCDAVDTLRTLIDQRGTDSLAELEEGLRLTFVAMTRLMRLAVPLTTQMPVSTFTSEAVSKVRQVLQGCRFLSADERLALENACNLLEKCRRCLQEANPKAHALAALLQSHRGLAIISPDSVMRAELTKASRASLVMSPDDAQAAGAATLGAVIPGWYRKDRMSALLIPPVSDPLFLLLYDAEARWYRLFDRERKRLRASRQRNRGRSRLFASVQGWNERQANPQPTDSGTEADRHAVDAVRDQIHMLYKQRVYSAAKADGVEPEVDARLVLFEGGLHAFLRDSYRAIVATHLLDRTNIVAADDAEVVRKSVDELRPGDAILFHRRSDRDVVRLTADDYLPDGTRQMAGTWQSALRELARRESLPAEEVWRRLREAGCPLHRQTIRGWLSDEDMIAPRQYERDVPIIATVTGDPLLQKNLAQVLTAIRTVFGAHQRASHRLAERVLTQAIEILRHDHDQSGLIEIESDIVLAKLVEIDRDMTRVRYSMANRLHAGTHEWHE